MSRATLKRKALQKLIKTEYKKFKDHKKTKLGKIFHLANPDESGCNWSIAIERSKNWESAADHIRPFIIELRSKYSLAQDGDEA